MQGIILFDGACNFCNSSVQFIIKRDSAAHFYFTSLQSETGEKLIEQFQLPTNEDSVILIEGTKVYTQSTAALRIAKKLDGLWRLLFILIIIPRPIRNFFYKIFSANRYKWFGSQENACTIPSPEIRKRFL